MESPVGEGKNSTICSKTLSIFKPVLAETGIQSSGSIPSVSKTSSLVRSKSADGKSILLITGRIVKSLSIAKYALANVWASTPWVASTTRRAPSQAANERETSYVKSTCPGVSIKLNK